MSKPLTAANLLFFDIETSGLRPDRGARITEVAVVDHRSAVIDWKDDTPFSDELLQVRLPVLFRQLYEGIVVGHNLSFDFGFLSYEAERLGVEMPAFRYIDTLSLARHTLGHGVEAHLKNLILHTGCKMAEPFHTALGDVYATRAVFWKLVERENFTTLDEAGAKTVRWSTY